jgi:translation elongation factor EF-Tu-like GTPase
MTFKMTVEDVFVIRNRGVVATGRVESGALRVGDTVRINGGLSARVDGIEAFRKSINEAKAGDNIGVLFRGVEKSQLDRGSVLTAPGGASEPESTAFIV